MKRLLHSILSRRRANAISAARDAARCVAGPNREFRGAADYHSRNRPGRRIHRWHVVNLAHGGGGRWRSANLRRAGSDWIEGALPAPDAGAMLGREDYNTNGAGAESAGIYNAVRNVRPRGPRAAGPA